MIANSSPLLPGSGSPPRPPTMLLSAKSAAAAMSISTRTLWGLTSRGVIPCVRIGRAVRYDTRDLVKFIDRSKASPPPAHAFPAGNAGPSVVQ